MNYSWGNNAAGFVYFNTNIPYQNVNTPDFMAFSDPYGSPTFSPVHYSSPNKFQNNPRNLYGRPPGRNSFRYHNSRDSHSFNSSNGSYNSTGFNNSRNKNNHQHGKNNSYQTNGQKDMSIYFDHTSVKNPWAELEQKLKKTKEAEVKTDSVIAQKGSANIEESSSSADEQESESETKTSSSELEEGTT